MLSSRARWATASAFWTFVTLVYALQLWFVTLQPGESLPYRRLVVWQGAFALIWIPLTVFIWRLTDRWDPAALGWRVLVARHALAACLAGPVQTLAVTALAAPWAPMPIDWRWPAILAQIRGRFYLQLIIYAGAAATGHALALFAIRREREARTAALETQLAAARLDALRAQLHPHFLFNSLHAISSLIRDERNADAVRLLSGLGDLLRRVLDTGTRELRLDEEIELVRRYLDIQQVRFGDRLRADLSVEPGAGAEIVPPLLIQPLVDNAVRHAINPRVEGGRLAVRVAAEDGVLVISVDDDGPGMPAGWVPGTGAGTGLRNLRDRLQATYGAAGRLAVSRSPLGGTRVVIRLPGRPT